MKKFIQFYTKDLAGRIRSELGSDGYRPTDGRLSLASIIAQVPAHKTLFTINAGSLRQSHAIYTSTALEQARVDGATVVLD